MSWLLNIYYILEAFENVIVLICWSVGSLQSYQYILTEPNQHVHDFLNSLLMAILFMSISYAVKQILIKGIQLYLWKDIADDVFEWVTTEHMLILLEGVEFTTAAFVAKKLQPENIMKQSESAALQAMEKSIEKGEDTVHIAAGKAATNIMKKITRGQKNELDIDDVVYIFGEKNATKALSLLDDNEDGVIDYEDLLDSLVWLYKQHKKLVNALKGKTLELGIFNSIGTLILVGVCIYLCMKLLLPFFFDISWDTFLLSLGTTVIALSFAYGATLQEVFDSLYMIFLVRPFAVGDWVTVDDGEIMVVEKVDVLTTYFITKRGAGVYLRNSFISHAKLTNLNRGGKIAFEFSVVVNWDTSPEEIKEFHTRVCTWCKTGDIYSPKVVVHTDSCEDEQTYFNVILRVRLRKRWKWQNEEKWKIAKNDLLLHCYRIIDDLDIGLEPYPNPIRLVNAEGDDLPSLSIIKNK